MPVAVVEGVVQKIARPLAVKVDPSSVNFVYHMEMNLELNIT